jgi:hypothetical protein
MTVVTKPESTIFSASQRANLAGYIRLRLKALGLASIEDDQQDGALDELTQGLLANFRQKSRLLKDYRAPVDQRIEAFLNQQLGPLPQPLRLPALTFSLNRAGVARELSLPRHGDHIASSYVSSYRLLNGVLHNPRSDRRTTKGTFHVTDCGLPVPADKIAVPPAVFAALFQLALQPPRDLMTLPYTTGNATGVEVFCSLLLRPIVVPEVPGVSPQKTMEIHFFAPGSLVSNLDFVESIFGNAGDPALPENDAALDTQHWTGHTGCVILAPHLTQCTKKQLGLPHYDQATDRQKRDGMCWKTDDECYNNGSAFKLTCRSSGGVMVTLIADNYFGYCKKEVKTQISFAANLLGNAEEEHAGGAVAFASYSLGTEYTHREKYWNGRTFDDVARDYGSIMTVMPEGYGIDKRWPEIIYLPHEVHMDLYTLMITWKTGGVEHCIPLLADKVYFTPSGEKLYLHKHPGSERFRIVVTTAEGTFCHKPCTVSGGGKSEISKSLADYMIYGPIYINNLEADLAQVEVILKKDHSVRWKPGNEPHDYSATPSRPILSPRRSLGSVIKLLTPSADYTDDYNRWLTSVPANILALVFLIKRLYQPEWGERWRDHFSVDIINGEPGHELKMDDRKAAGTYLRVGLLPNGAWNTFKVRQDFFPAAKVQMEDDITASTVVPARQLPFRLNSPPGGSVKLTINTETRLFQRPDDAIYPGLDKQTEADMARSDNFLSNYEPLDSAAVRKVVDRITEFDAYTEPLKRVLRQAVNSGHGYVVSSAHPRLVEGKPSKNPRYLQFRPDLSRPRETYLAQMGVRLARALPLDVPVVFPVDAVLLGRRNNPPDPKTGIRALAVYNPIHYQELPELFMDFICSLTGASPSTTGAGSEGALTKGPFNALLTTADLNAALVSYVLTGLAGFSSAAGYAGPKRRFGHDISLLIPELWCRLKPQERNPAFLIAGGYLEKLEDFEYQGKTIPASRLGYRVTARFMRTFLGRIFDNPARVFDEATLKPELQGMDVYVDGILNIAEAQQRVASQYFEDGSVEQAAPPIKALLHIMARGTFEGKDVRHPEIRKLFTREAVLAGDWYQQRLVTKQKVDMALWKRHVDYLRAYMDQTQGETGLEDLQLPTRLAMAQRQLATVSHSGYVHALTGTIGVDPCLYSTVS